jgi:hypothetical protein
MIMRRRPLLRAAAVGGTAYAVGRSNARRQAEQQYQDQDQDARLAALEAQQQQQAYAPPPPQQQQAYIPQQAPASGEPSIADQLNQLIELHNNGHLTDAEFAAAKASVLGKA